MSSQQVLKAILSCQQVTTHNLERVRRVKSRMVRLTTRVETVRELLEKFLDGDSDMHDMNLTARQQDLLDRQTSLIRNSLIRTSLTGIRNSSIPCPLMSGHMRPQM